MCQEQVGPARCVTTGTGPRHRPTWEVDTVSDMLSAPPHADPGRSTREGDPVVREEGTGPFRCFSVSVPTGVHPATIATTLRTLPLGCVLMSMTDGEMRFKPAEPHHGSGWNSGPATLEAPPDRS